MKNKKILIIFIFLISVFAIKVNAASNPFNLEWSNDELSRNYNIEASLFNAKLEFNDGYTTFYTNTNNNDSSAYTLANYFSKEGKVITSKKYDNYAIMSATTDNQNIYALAIKIPTMVPKSKSSMGSSRPYLYVLKINSKMEIEKEYELSYDEEEMIRELPVISNIFGMSTMSIVDDRVNILASNFDIIQLDLGLKSSKVISSSESRMKKYFEDMYYLVKLNYTGRNDYLSLDKNEKYMAYSDIGSCMNLKWTDIFHSYADEQAALEDGYNYCQESHYLVLDDVEGNNIWEEEFKENEFIIDVKLVDNYIVAIKKTFNNVRERTISTIDYNDDVIVEIVVYDLEGNLVQTIEKDSLYLQLTPVKNGFMVNNNVSDKKTCMSMDINSIQPIISYDEYLNGCAIDTVLEVYTTPYTITPKITGNGHLEVASSSRAGNNEVFKIVADKGWKVGSIKITDEQGNVIEYKGDTFIMPSSNVTIAVNFVIDVLNPNTSDIWIIGAISLAIIFGIIIIINKKKLKFLK